MGKYNTGEARMNIFIPFCILFSTLVYGGHAESVLILGGEVYSVLHPAIAEVESYGSCGFFDAGVPDLPKQLREFGSARIGNLLVVCGGYALLGTSLKDCYSLELGVWPPVWSTFPSMIHGRHNHALVTVGGDMYAVGGSSFIGSVRSIERYSPETGVWEEFSEVAGYRQDFCVLPLGEDSLVLIGGYNDIGAQTIAEKFNVTTKSWTRIADLNTERGMHACTWHNGKIVVAGGWTPVEDPDFVQQEPSRTVETYSVEDDIWTNMTPMRHRRTQFGLISQNGNLTAFGGFEGQHLDSVEWYNQEADGWEYDHKYLNQKKSAFALAPAGDFFADLEC